MASDFDTELLWQIQEVVREYEWNIQSDYILSPMP